MYLCAHLLNDICYSYTIKNKALAQAGKGDNMTAIVSSITNKFETYVIKNVTSVTYVENTLIIIYNNIGVCTSTYSAHDVLVSIA